MPTIYPEEIFADEAGCTPHWPRSDLGHVPKPFVYPTAASSVGSASKAATGIAGFDEITGGGLPRGRTTLLIGRPGFGKMLLGLQFLVQGAQQRKMPAYRLQVWSLTGFNHGWRPA